MQRNNWTELKENKKEKGGRSAANTNPNRKGKKHNEKSRLKIRKRRLPAREEVAEGVVERFERIEEGVVGLGWDWDWRGFIETQK